MGWCSSGRRAITCRALLGTPARQRRAGAHHPGALIDPNVFSGSCEQMSLFSPPAALSYEQGVLPRAAVRMVREEAVSCQHCKPQGGHASRTMPTWSTCMTAALRAFCAGVRELCPARASFAVWTPQRETATSTRSRRDPPTPPSPGGCSPALAKSWAQRPSTRQPGISPGRRTRSRRRLRFRIWPFALGPGTVKREGHPVVAPLYAMKKESDWEVDKFQGFVRLRSTTGCWARVIHPV